MTACGLPDNNVGSVFGALDLEDLTETMCQVSTTAATKE